MRPLITATAIAFCTAIPAQSRVEAQQCDRLNVPRAAALGAAFAVGQATALAVRGDDWWGSTPRQGFHFTSGGSPARQQDALLHGAIGYQSSRLAAVAWRWACVSPRTAAWLGALTGFAIGLPKEIGDGFHNGFSADDMAATAIAAALPALHQTSPGTRVVSFKVFYWPSQEFRNRVPGGLPQLENDYAGQRYFLSINPGRSPGSSGWPRWLGFAVGHSVSGWVSAQPVDEWYLTLDLDPGGLPVRSGWWRSFTWFADQIHIPAPGIRLRSGTIDFGFF